MKIQNIPGVDVHWAGATVVWDSRRGCWALPGGKITRIESVALESAKSIANIMASKQQFIRKVAA